MFSVPHAKKNSKLHRAINRAPNVPKPDDISKFPTKQGLVVDHLLGAAYEIDQYDDSKLKESWRLLVRYHQSQESEIFDSVKNSTICHFQSWVTIPDKACLLQVNL